MFWSICETFIVFISGSTKRRRRNKGSSSTDRLKLPEIKSSQGGSGNQQTRYDESFRMLTRYERDYIIRNERQHELRSDWGDSSGYATSRYYCMLVILMILPCDTVAEDTHHTTVVILVFSITKVLMI